MKIREKEYKCALSPKTFMMIEQANSGKIFELKSTTDFYILFFYAIVANNKDINLDEFSFENFLDYLGENPELIKEFQEIVTNYYKRISLSTGENSDVKKKV